MQEAKAWEGIEKSKAKKRQAITGSKNLGLVSDPGHTLEDKDRATDAIAEKVKLGSGRTYERAKKVVEKIDKLKINIEIKLHGKLQDIPPFCLIMVK